MIATSFSRILAVFTLLAACCGLLAHSAQADYIYRADSNADAPSPLYEYNTLTDTWSTRAVLPASNYTQLASDSTGLYALPSDGNIYRYDRVADAWNFVLAGPAGAPVGTPIAMFEVHEGEFYYGNDGQSAMYYTSSGAWSTIGTPRPISSGSDMDVASDQLYIRTYRELGGFVYDIASNTFPVIFNDNTSMYENSRVGGFFSGDFYSRVESGNLMAIDPVLSTATDTGVSLQSTHASMEITPSGLVYLNGYSATETTFEVFDINTNTRTTLAAAPAFPGGNAHSTLAWVAIPEPTSVVIACIGVATPLLLRVRRNS